MRASKEMAPAVLEHPGARTMKGGFMIDPILPHHDPEERERRRKKTRMLLGVLVGSCAGCGASGLDEDLVPVEDGHLAFFPGDELCRSCAVAHGVL